MNLTPEQYDWISEKMKNGYEESRAVGTLARTVAKGPGPAPYPSMVAQVVEQIREDQVAAMQRAEQKNSAAAFSFQVEPIMSYKAWLELWGGLSNGNPIRGIQVSQSLGEHFTEEDKNGRQIKFSHEEPLGSVQGWRWAFVQGHPGRVPDIVTADCVGRDSYCTLATRAAVFGRHLDFDPLKGENFCTRLEGPEFQDNPPRVVRDERGQKHSYSMLSIMHVPAATYCPPMLGDKGRFIYLFGADATVKLENLHFRRCVSGPLNPGA